jgi:transcriptional regulator with XRE-family HTH domain
MPRSRERTKLETHGWRVGSAANFLELSSEEEALVDFKLALSQALRTRRAEQRVSQAALARRLKSSQSRVAKMEAADPSVSTDLLLRGLFALGATPRDVARAVQRSRHRFRAVVAEGNRRYCKVLEKLARKDRVRARRNENALELLDVRRGA